MNQLDLTLHLGHRTVPLSVGFGRGLVIIGPNGAGKTTLLRTLVGVQRLHGQLWLDGRAGVPDNVAWLPQDDNLVPFMSALDNVNLGWGDEPSARRVLADVGVEDLGRPVRGLSGGQRRRVALARALVRPGLLVLDEPLVSVDVAARHRLRDRINERLLQGSWVMATHDVRDVLAFDAPVLYLGVDGPMVASWQELAGSSEPFLAEFFAGCSGQRGPSIR